MDPSTGTEPGTERAALRPAPVPEPSTKVAVPVPAGVRPVTVPERATAAARSGGTAIVKATRELWLMPDRLLYVAWHGKPESMAEHRAYVKSRAWVPPEMTGGAEKAVIGAGLFYHLLIGRPLLAAANALGAAAARPLRLLGLAVFTALLIVILARYP